MSLGEFRAMLGATLGVRHSSLASFCTLQLASRSASGPEGQKNTKKKNTWGGKTKSACENGPEGAEKTPPSQTKGPGRSASEGPCDPLAHKKAVKNPEKEGTNPPPSRGFPSPSLGRGAGEITHTGLREITGRAF